MILLYESISFNNINTFFVLKYTMPATSVECERIFSYVGQNIRNLYLSSVYIKETFKIYFFNYNL